MERSLGLQEEEAVSERQRGYPHLSPLQATAESRRLEKCDRHERLHGCLGGPGARKELREWNRASTHMTFLRERSCGPWAGLAAPRVGRDGCRESG